MIGDRIDNDIAPAKQLGMKTVWVRQGFSKYQSAKSVSVQPNFIVDKVSELVKVLKVLKQLYAILIFLENHLQNKMMKKCLYFDNCCVDCNLPMAV